MSRSMETTRVVVVDDDRRARSGLAALLATWPEIEVVGLAADGADAVRMCAEHEPDVVILDAIMPVLDGVEAARRIRREHPAMGIVLLTLYGSLEHDARDAGVDAFIMKSEAVDEVAAAVLRAAGRRSDAAGSARELV